MKDLRNDIQGLRALAVVAVILYHFKIGPFFGGYVGVDIFFVISGYLITKKIVSDQTTSIFSLDSYFLARVRRIFPAMLATVALVFLTGAELYSPIDFQSLSGATIFAAFGASNMYFWNEAGYFDSAAITKPLLHTWSLAVEIQFYLIWPVVILTAGRYGTRALAACIVLVALLSFAGTLYAMKVDPTAAFFWMPLRIWEFAAGGVVVLLERRRIPRAVAEPLYAAGLIAVVVPIFAYGRATPFPGVSALAPVLGTAVMIFSGPYARLSALSTVRPAPYLGEISYSLYLVHWPLIVFLQYVIMRSLTVIDQVALLAATLVGAMLLHRYVEQPLRRPWKIRLAPAVVAAIVALAIAVPASTSWAGSGWIWRFPAEIRAINDVDIPAMKAYVWKNFRPLRQLPYESGKRHVLVIGDSQAGDLVNMITESRPEGISIRTIETWHACGAILVPEEHLEHYIAVEDELTVKSQKDADICRRRLKEFRDSKIIKDADLIIIASFWRAWSLPYLKSTVQQLEQISGAPVFVVGRKDLRFSSMRIVNANGKVEGLSERAYLARNPEALTINAAVKELVPDNYIDLMGVTCPDASQCAVADEKMHPLFHDPAHITPDGATFFGARLMASDAIPGLSGTTFSAVSP